MLAIVLHKSLALVMHSMSFSTCMPVGQIVAPHAPALAVMSLKYDCHYKDPARCLTDVHERRVSYASLLAQVGVVC